MTGQAATAGQATAPPDRRLLLLSPDSNFNGVDFAEVHPAQEERSRRDEHRGPRVRLDVHFVNRIGIRGTLASDRAPVTLTGGEAPRALIVEIHESTAWSTDTSGRPVLHVTTDRPAVRSRYVLTVHSDRLDPRFRSTAITIPGWAGNDNPDCAVTVPGPVPDELTVPVDYLAKDFVSFCQALSDFSAARYPRWAERSEADMGVMLMEALSALADELSYLQDRVAAEATIDTATQPLSLLRHARLVDYEPSPPVAATALLQLDVADPPPAGLVRCQAAGDQGVAVDFTADAGSSASATGAGPPGVGNQWNRYGDEAGTQPQLVPYRWDAGERCLRHGATGMWLRGHHEFYAGQELLIDTAGSSGSPPVRQVVRLIEWEQSTDPVTEAPVTRIRWEEGLTSDHDLTRTEIAGNLLRAVQGRAAEEVFVIPGGPAAPGVPGGQSPPLATARASRVGAGGGQPVYLYTLAAPPAWCAVPILDGGAPAARPVIRLTAVADEGDSQDSQPVEWPWVRRLLDADGGAQVFTVTPDRYSPAGIGSDLSFYDYDGAGTTVRFGDNTFGGVPALGTTFRAWYLTGGGAAGNVSAGTILTVASVDPSGGRVWRCTNPFPAMGGADPETPAQIRDRAPQRFHDGLLTLTSPADYQSAAESFEPGGPGTGSWARFATAEFRWTGSWFSALTTVDPRADEPPAALLDGLAGLAEVLGVRGLTGSEGSVAIARYLRLDLKIIIQVDSAHRRADVESAVLARLDPWPAANGSTGFFGRDKWGFGKPLEASALKAEVQSCPGVAGVEIRYRRELGSAEWVGLPDTVHVAARQILRIDNDPNRPEDGLLFVTSEVTA